MRVLRGDQPAPPELHRAAIALGVMDGVHLGHQAVLDNARAAAGPLAAAVFEPPPRRHFRPDHPPFRLQTAAQRARALAALGVDAIYEVPFDAALANIRAEAFVRDVLAGRLRAAHIAVGFDFHFGKDREGDPEKLRAFGAAHGFTVGVVPRLEHAGEKISSTAIRALVAEGRVQDAARLLTRPWAIEGEVQHGDHRGRTIGFPTANIPIGDYIRPKFGVYAIRTSLDGRAIAGVANIGLRPTIGGDAVPRLEAHLFDIAVELYGRTLEIELHAFIRPERKFDSLDALKAQIELDAAAAKAALR